MAVDAFHSHITVLFDPLTKAPSYFPPPGSLSEALNPVFERERRQGVKTQSISLGTFTLFATASVELWHRSIHSFLVSAALTTTSPMWASVSGYYASHYTVRALAHLFGHFQSHRGKRVVRVEKVGRQYLCHVQGKPKGEHSFYWKILKDQPSFAANPFFTRNDEDQPVSDVSHRNVANYVDHLNSFPGVQALDRAAMEERVKKISGIVLSAPPIPRRESYPDVERVQVVAYHRLVAFRSLLDNVLGGGNRFWTTHRTPGWCSELIDFQLTEPKFLTLYRDLV